MTIWISRELPLFNFESLKMWCAWVAHPSENLWPFEFLESLRCSISSVSINYALESDLRVKSYDHSNFSRASVVEFRESRWVISANWTSLWKVMTIRISRVLPLCNFEHPDILSPKFWHPCQKLWPFEFLRSSVVQFRASRYIMSPNQTSEWKVMTIRISRELPMFNLERLDELRTRIGHPREKVWPFEFLEYFLCAISSLSIHYVLNSDIRVKSYDHSNSRELPLCNFERLDILSPKFGHPC